LKKRATTGWSRQDLEVTPGSGGTAKRKRKYKTTIKLNWNLFQAVDFRRPDVFSALLH
jgi:hypothetical protein